MTFLRAASAALTLATVATGQIHWTTSLDSALEQAAADNTIVVIAINMPGERASDRMLEDHYRDPLLKKLGAATVNLMFQVGPNMAYDPDERKVRERYLKVEPMDPVAVPHHLFIKPIGQGELISSVAYALTAGQLEWAWVDAIRRVDPEFEWQLSDRARAPEGLKYQGVEAGSEITPPPTKDELEAALKEAKKSGGGGRRGGRGGGGANAWRQALETFGVIIRSDRKEALKYGESSLRSLGRGAWLQGALRAIGENSPEAWWSVVEEYLEDRTDKVREESARALEQLAAKKSLSPLKKQFKAEKNETVAGRVLRAMAAVAPADKSVASAITKTLKKSKSANIRVQAVAAASVLEQPEAVLEHATLAFADDDPNVRAAAAYLVASRRDEALVELLEQHTKAEKNNETKHWVTTAIEVAKGGDLDEFKEFVKDVLGDRLEKQDPNALMRGGRGEGDGNGGDGEGGGGRGGD